MTDVIVLKNIAGHRAGEIAKLDARLQKHVDAGNARILADSAPAEPEPEKWPPPSSVPEPAPWAIESSDEDDDESED